ncbi:OmpA family protein [Halarcobacter sp.]|uniref:OmpA family protein n=1 Tax=Halarcobacter sp. TaxID=2321133 RepID=UPI002AA94FD2|nr:OmpA family protein [Halarcobacter sp.]
MSSEKKVIFLFLLLIALIVSCVYIHAPKLAKENEPAVSFEPTQLEIEPIINSPLNNINEENNKIEIEENNLNNENQQETQVIEVETNIEKKVEDSLENDTTDVVEEIIEPLLTTPAKYIRENNEKNIEDLSIDTQKLQIEINDYVKEHPVIFKRAGYKTTKKSDKTIKRVAQFLKDNPNIKMEIAGHTDAAGKAKVNQQISFARAQTVKNRLIFFGIDKNRLIARGYGEDIPIEPNSPNGYSKENRRVEFNIVEE